MGFDQFTAIRERIEGILLPWFFSEKVIEEQDDLRAYAASALEDSVMISSSE